MLNRLKSPDKSAAGGAAERGAVILQVRDLATHFPVRNGTVRAVDGVSFDVARGRTLAIVGESGSGKSVMARSILQIVDAPGRIVSGSMMFTRQDGSTVDLARLRPKGRAIAIGTLLAFKVFSLGMGGGVK